MEFFFKSRKLPVERELLKIYAKSSAIVDDINCMSFMDISR